jgi:hypothetical protein
LVEPVSGSAVERIWNADKLDRALGNPRTGREGETRDEVEKKERRSSSPDKPAAAFENRRFRIILRSFASCFPVLPSSRMRGNPFCPFAVAHIWTKQQNKDLPSQQFSACPLFTEA